MNLLSKLVTSEDKRGGPAGVDGVEIVSVVADAVVLNFTAGNGAVDTITFNFADGKLDADYNVGGFARGEKDVATLLAAGMDEDFGAVDLIGLNADSFTVQVSRGSAADTFTFTGSDAVAAIEDVAGNIINPGNVADQFVFVSADAADGQLIGIGTANSADKALGGQLRVGELVDFVADGKTASGLEITDIGDAMQVEFDGNAGTTDTVVLPDALFL